MGLTHALLVVAVIGDHLVVAGVWYATLLFVASRTHPASVLILDTASSAVDTAEKFLARVAR